MEKCQEDAESEDNAGEGGEGSEDGEDDDEEDDEEESAGAPKDEEDEEMADPDAEGRSRSTRSCAGAPSYAAQPQPRCPQPSGIIVL